MITKTYFLKDNNTFKAINYKINMRKITPIIFVLVLLTSLSFIIAFDVFPHGFNGIVTIKDGKNPDGQTILGKINGVTTGSCIISDGKYDLVITDNVREGGEIEFYICNEKAEEISEFITFEVTELDLTFNTIPLDLCDCGNGVCDENECSSCAIDCRISDCIGNGRCDVEIGENCLTSPEDCACSSGYECINRVCKKEDTDSSNDNSGTNDNSPGGGSPSSSSPITTTGETTSDSDSQNGILSIDSLNEADRQRETGSGITGGVIGFAKSGSGTVLIFVLLVLIIGIGVMTLKKKTPKNE